MLQTGAISREGDPIAARVNEVFGCEVPSHRAIAGLPIGHCPKHRPSTIHVINPDVGVAQQALKQPGSGFFDPGGVLVGLAGQVEHAVAQAHFVRVLARRLGQVENHQATDAQGQRQRNDESTSVRALSTDTQWLPSGPDRGWLRASQRAPWWRGCVWLGGVGGHVTSMRATTGRSGTQASPSKELSHVDLFEYQGRAEFARFGLPVPPGGIADDVDTAVKVAEESGYPVVIKAQVQVGGRGKAGGVKLAENADEVRLHAGNILGMDIKGHVVHRLFVANAADIAEEYYASYTLDRTAKMHLLMLSAEGGVEIEEVAVTNPGAIVKLHINPVDGISLEAARQACVDAKLNPAAVDQAAAVLVQLYTCFTEGDCDLAEINPLVLTPQGKVLALDAKVSLDENAMFRHPEWAEYEATVVRDAREHLAHDKGLQYIGLEGSVGIIANGAGLAMSTLDVVNQVGGSAANFLDIGGGANADVMTGALEVINTDAAVKSIFINIFGGITRGEEVAKGIVEALKRVTLNSPIVIRLDGTNAEEGRQILLDAGIPADKLISKPTMLEAARAAVELAKR